MCLLSQLGCALVSAPSATLFRVLGRIGGFLCGAVAGMLGGVLGLVALRQALPPVVFFVACALVGVAQGLGQFYRFAALEVCPTRKPLAVTLVLSGGVIAAFAGPQLALFTRHITPFRGVPSRLLAETASQFEGSFLAMIALHFLNAVLSLVAYFPWRAATRQQQLGRQRVGERTAPLLTDDAAAYPSSLAPTPMPPPTTAPAAGVTNPLKDPYSQVTSTTALEGIATISVLPPRVALLERMLQPQCALAVAIAACAQCMMVAMMSPLALLMADDNFSPPVVCPARTQAPLAPATHGLNPHSHPPRTDSNPSLNCHESEWPAFESRVRIAHTHLRSPLCVHVRARVCQRPAPRRSRLRAIGGRWRRPLGGELRRAWHRRDRSPLPLGHGIMRRRMAHVLLGSDSHARRGRALAGRGDECAGGQ